MTDSLDQTVSEWMTARNVIVQWLKEHRPDMTQDILEHNAAALIDRLIWQDPPLLIMSYPKGK